MKHDTDNGRSRMPALLARCHAGIVALHPAHHTHNIPGKLLAYLHAGLPVLARVNANNDLVELVEREGVGLVVAGDDADLLHAHASAMADDEGLRKTMGEAGTALATRFFPQRGPPRPLLPLWQGWRRGLSEYVAGLSSRDPFSIP